MLFSIIKNTNQDSSTKKQKYFDETYVQHEYSLNVFVQDVLLLLENLTRKNK